MNHDTKLVLWFCVVVTLRTFAFHGEGIARFFCDVALDYWVDLLDIGVGTISIEHESIPSSPPCVFS